jgi:hypothetical protein
MRAFVRLNSTKGFEQRTNNQLAATTTKRDIERNTTNQKSANAEYFLGCLDVRGHQEAGGERERFWCTWSPKGTRQPDGYQPTVKSTKKRSASWLFGKKNFRKK